MEIIHVSAECYPVAKAGGLGDVVGALPKYLNAAGHIAKVVMPMYRTKFLYENEWELVHEGGAYMGNNSFHYSVIKEKNNKLGFDLYLIDVNGLLDRERIYGYYDDTERFLSFQIAFCDWLSRWNHRPDVVHVHDHHTALIPFMLQHCYAYRHLAAIPTVLTIHNAQYQGWFGWDKQHLIPPYDSWKWGMLDWNNTVNPLACGIKCASRVTTVSWSYLEELQGAANGLESLLRAERGKSVGILNGIDDKIWDPATDTYLQDHYNISGMAKGKLGNKKTLCEVFGLNPQKPLFVFIGRLVGEKAADLLPGAIEDAFYYIGRNMNILVLGSGEPWVESRLLELKEKYAGDYNVFIGYNETLSHQMYAGADFLLMPSRVEPCGLNQMYAMRYGTIPLVRDTGGLRDTVIDIGDHQGYGIRFREATVGELTHAMYRALDLYKNKEQLGNVRAYMMKLDFSWDKSAEQYCNVYQSIIS
ncbi:glycogen synthase [Parasegetibacter sp. NRK P23]|uniref:glycogen synthase n=1 Tax=Parasegetibacter sp. NRK P23 TaxID=2942999 RepID=UPI00204301F7|nr:glycogen synthase [Parasegetibacter sp. NRK P23]MCM5528375.1 glycogen synthase [Parasegetibacter sp. NRK P23]